MFVLAHILGVPVEELMMTWISGGVCAGMLMVFASFIDDFLRTLPLKLQLLTRQAHCIVEKER